MERCQGMRDWLPQEMSRFRHVEGVFRDTCLKWGYEEIRTPVVEYLHLFTASGTLSPEMLSRVYSFLDWDGWSGQRVVLRPDSTIPAARLYISQLPQPLARLFYVQNVFSFQASQRERWQCGAEFLGGTPPGADAELMLLALEVLRGLGLKPELKLSHLGLIKSLLQELGQEEEALHPVLRGEIQPLLQAKPELRDALRLLFELGAGSPGFLRNIQSLLLPHLPGLAPALANFLSIAELLTSLSYAYEIDMASAGGFEYYTGVVFQFLVAGERLGSGGRYDNLLPLLGGRQVPASGFALFMEPLMRLVASPPLAVRILVRASSPQGAFTLAEALRSQGYSVEVGQGSAPAITVWQEGDSFQVINHHGEVRRPTSLEGVCQVLEAWGAVKVSPT